MHLILSDAGKRTTTRLAGKEKGELFNIVWTTLYGEENTGMEEIAVDECWAKHNITLPVDVFDHVRVFQFDEDNESRILWCSTSGISDSVVHEVRVSRRPCWSAG
jgi:hypothetical protein